MWAAADLPRAPVGDFPPAWASAWGDDPCGLWADLTVAGISQRLRWIEPGHFTMGSSTEERRGIDDQEIREWADQNEAPRHRVTISRGFWLADTPCTQALWTALLGGENPSQFQTGDDAAQRPVERLDWVAAETWLAALKRQLPEADPQLPTDAQWEYACRAGSLTAYAWGDAADTRLANMAQSVGQTTPVKRYPSNAWGLYDMHGNVWEWCADDQRSFADRPEVDPLGGTEGGARVLRGGAWNDRAARARAAYRLRDQRGSAWHDDGFRFALRSPSPAGGAGGR